MASKKRKPLKAVITHYREYFRWKKDLRTGKETVWLHGKQISVKQFNELQERKLRP